MNLRSKSVRLQVVMLRVCAFLLGASVGTPQAVSALKVATLNIRGESSPEIELDPTEKAWHVRKDPLLKSVLDQSPTVIAFQEARLEPQKNDIIDGLNSTYDCNAVEIAPGQHYEYNMICWERKSAVLVEQRHFWISRTPDVPGTKSWKMKFARMAVLAKFKLRASEEPFYLLSTHMDWKSKRSRQEAVRLIKERINFVPRRSLLIVVGDFNEPIGETAYTLITGDDNSTPTWVEYEIDVPLFEPMILDYILVHDNGCLKPHNREESLRDQIDEGRRWTVDSFKVVPNTFKVDGDKRLYSYSDHKMLIAELFISIYLDGRKGM